MATLRSERERLGIVGLLQRLAEMSPAQPLTETIEDVGALQARIDEETLCFEGRVAEWVDDRAKRLLEEWCASEPPDRTSP